MKQSAVEWLEDKLNNVRPTQICSIETIKEWVEQAKEIEKEQRGYSEEEVYHILCEHTAFLFAGGKSTLTEWFEQFKK